MSHRAQRQVSNRRSRLFAEKPVHATPLLAGEGSPTDGLGSPTSPADLTPRTFPAGALSRPLTIAGGPHAVYQPYEMFSANPADPTAPDVVVTGEEFVLLSLLEVILETRGQREPMRSAFARARDAGALDNIPGLIYP